MINVIHSKLQEEYYMFQKYENKTKNLHLTVKHDDDDDDDNNNNNNNNRGVWDYLKVIQKVREQHTMKT